MTAWIAIVAAGVAGAASGFPADYLGRWGEGAEGCSAGAIHGGLTISTRSIADGEFSGDVLKVKRRTDGSIEVTERWDDLEEEGATFVTSYRLSKNGKSLAVREISASSEKAETRTLIRCGRAR